MTGASYRWDCRELSPAKNKPEGYSRIFGKRTPMEGHLVLDLIRGDVVLDLFQAVL